MEYHFKDIEKKWQNIWDTQSSYKIENINPSKPKCFVLDMFPYPSGAGLHVGHPLGYIASDIYSRYKRLKGYTVLHPMGYDAFGLPAEQYAIEKGIHPKTSTEENINNFRKQLNRIGFCYDWSREIRTCDPSYYKWTQWIFLQLFGSWFNPQTQKAESINTLINHFTKKGTEELEKTPPQYPSFSANEWQSYNEEVQQAILMYYRLMYCDYGEVNWCEALGTVLANDEVINGRSERGGHRVVKKKLRQWYLRITDYASRLQEDLKGLKWSDAMKEMQTNWIGKSAGAEIHFPLQNNTTAYLKVYTTRPDTIFGVDFMVIAPEHDIIPSLITDETKATVENYLKEVASRSERDRMTEKTVSGCFSGAYCLHPLNKKAIPIWISEYVLIGYGTGAIMAVPCGDERDFAFAKKFNLPITNIIGDAFNGEEANPTKKAILSNSDFLNGIPMDQATILVVNTLEKQKMGKRKTNYKIRDAAFSRQRYWGEPIPIVWKNNTPYPLPASALPLTLPDIKEYKPGKDGASPLSNLDSWVHTTLTIHGKEEAVLRETNTMPGFAGSSWYFLRYMDPHNEKEFCNKEKSNYWNQVDLYIGGTEHAVGHLLYSRMWTKVLYDLGYISFNEPFARLVNQGMIQGSSRFVPRTEQLNTNQGNIPLGHTNTFISGSYAHANDKERETYHNKILNILPKLDNIYHLQNYNPHEKIIINNIESTPIYVDINMVDGTILKQDEHKHAYLQNKPTNHYYLIDDEDGKFYCPSEVEKMSKSKLNVVNPDKIIDEYGADTFRLYEMFLGPIEQSKPWDTKGIEGVHRFLKKLWRLFYDDIKGKQWNTLEPSANELKILHKTIKKVEEDTDKLSFNTAISTMMVCVNELHSEKCYTIAILAPLLILLSPYAPHICAELWTAIGKENNILEVNYPIFNPSYIVEESKEYPICINGKMRMSLSISLQATEAEIKDMVLQQTAIQKLLAGKTIQKFIFVKGKTINIVVPV